MTRLYALVYALVPVLAAVLIAPAGTARAAEPSLLGQFGEWSAYVFNEDGGKVCFMTAQPKKMEGNYTKRGDVFAQITHRPAEGSKDVFSYITGYSFKAGSDANITIDGETFALFTQDDTAWAPDAVTDEKLAQALRKGSTMTIKGTSSRGTLTTDTFNLKGTGAAHDAINKECAAP